MTGALGYGLEYTYSVMERIRAGAFAGDSMLAFPMLGTPGFEVSRIKESKAPSSAYPLWGSEEMSVRFERRRPAVRGGRENDQRRDRARTDPQKHQR